MSNQRDLSNFTQTSDGTTPFFVPKNEKVKQNDRLPGEFVTGIYLGRSRLPSKYEAHPTLLCFETNNIVRFMSHNILISCLSMHNVSVGDVIQVISKGEKKIESKASPAYGKTVSSYEVRKHPTYKLQDAEKKAIDAYNEWESEILETKNFNLPRPLFNLGAPEVETVITAAKKSTATATAPAPLTQELNPFA